MIEIKGIKELNTKLARLAKIAQQEAEKELADIALDLGSKCSNAAPVLYGELRGELAKPRKEGDLSWQVGASLPYTRKQHEGVHFRHPKGGGAKFIENPFNQNANKYIKEIGDAIGRKLK